MQSPWAVSGSKTGRHTSIPFEGVACTSRNVYNQFRNENQLFAHRTVIKFYFHPDIGHLIFEQFQNVSNRESFVQKLQYFLSLEFIFKYNPGKINDKFVTSQ